MNLIDRKSDRKVRKVLEKGDGVLEKKRVLEGKLTERDRSVRGKKKEWRKTETKGPLVK